MSALSGANTGNYAGRLLEAYLLPEQPWEEVLALQHRLVYEVSGARTARAAVILTEHPPIITFGRQGSRAHLFVEEDELKARGVPMRWTNRGGGVWLHAPGQLLLYPILPFDPDPSVLEVCRDLLYETMMTTLTDFQIEATLDRRSGGVWVGDRQIGGIGLAMQHWTTYHGCWLNVNMMPAIFRWVQSNPVRSGAMTSMFRERRSPLRMSAVREAWLRNFTEAFGFADSLVSTPPVVKRPKRHVSEPWLTASPRRAV